MFSLIIRLWEKEEGKWVRVSVRMKSESVIIKVRVKCQGMIRASLIRNEYS